MRKESVLRVPGPTPVPPQVAQAMSRPMIPHRGAGFRALWREVYIGLRHVLQTQNECVILAGSGTAAMEAAVVNLVEAGTKALVVVAGKFGERWQEIATAYGAEVATVTAPLGQGVQLEQLSEALQRFQPEIVFLTHTESSTGVQQDIKSAAGQCRDMGALVVVNAVSSIGGAEFYTDNWGVDVIVTGSQKCLMLPPGLGLLAVSETAWQRMEHIRTPRFYLDLLRYRKANAGGEAPYTPAISLVYGLQESLRMIRAEGLENAWQRHILMQQMVRRGFEAMGLELFVEERWASPTVTVVHTPRGVNMRVWQRDMAMRTGVLVSDGFDDLLGKVFRIGHMGYVTPLEMLTALSAIEVALAAEGYSIKNGVGVAAAQTVWLNWAD